VVFLPGFYKCILYSGCLATYAAAFLKISRSSYARASSARKLLHFTHP